MPAANKGVASQARLQELFTYCPDSGLFVRKIDVSSFHVGEKAGHLALNGYIAIGVDGRRYYAHRLAWLYVHGEWPSNEIDHINGNRADNRLCNLRLADRSQNNQNKRAALPNNKTGILGVSFSKRENKYRATIKLNGRQRHLGYFSTAGAAEQAYLTAKQQLHTHAVV